MVKPDKKFWEGRRVLITGNTGFKGSWLSLWLLSMGATVWGYSHEILESPSLFSLLDLEGHSPDKFEGSFRQKIGNICDLDTLKSFVSDVSPDVVFHLAAQALVRPSYSDPLGTWLTNVQGSLNLLESLKLSSKPCSVVVITTDKVYENREWDFGYRESDRLGGKDPYCASKAAAELAISSWRSSFCGSAPGQSDQLHIATARAGNVIGGGDWAKDRLIPDAIRSILSDEPISVRYPLATRPWQHVLEPLSGYILLAQKLIFEGPSFAEAFNFGPGIESNRSVQDILELIFQYWKGSMIDQSDGFEPHEAQKLHLQTDKAFHRLAWRPCWEFQETVERTVDWYSRFYEGMPAYKCCMNDINHYQ